MTEHTEHTLTPDAGGQPEVPAAVWCVDCRVDPITGLIAFPDFHAEFPRLLGEAVADGTPVGIAIGDVDDLKAYVEDDRGDPLSFGHLAGFAVMSRLGQVAKRWFWDHRPTAGCVSTFGGDEIILALAVDGPTTFLSVVRELQDRLNDTLPRTVSFAAGVVEPAHTALLTAPGAEFYLHIMTTIDRNLFHRKALQRRMGGPRSSFTVLADLDLGLSPVR